MQRFYFIGFLILLTFDTITQVGFKLAAMHTAPAALDIAWLQRVLVEGWIYCAVLGYIGAFFTYMTILKHAPIGPAFAATHLELVTVLIVSVLWLGERLAMAQIIGSILIMGGIALLATGKHSAEDNARSVMDAA